VLRFIAEFIAEQGYPPTRREICCALGISERSTVAAHEHLDRLEAKGFIRVTRMVSRGITITPAGREFLQSTEQPTAAPGAEGGS
jgi:repressor LexA